MQPTNRTQTLLTALLVGAYGACSGAQPTPQPPPTTPAAAPRDPAPAAAPGTGARPTSDRLDPQIVDAAKQALLKRYDERARIERGVDQLAALWRKDDGDLVAFVQEHFVPAGPKLDATFRRLEEQLEQTDGLLNALGVAARFPTDVEVGPLLPVDPLFSGWDPAAHLTDDMFQSKIAQVVLLNFPQTTLKERMAEGPDYSRRRWAEVRLAGRFSARVPAAVSQRITAAADAGQRYIADYNIYMHHVLDEHGGRPFPKGLRLISHWNLRDELKAAYADAMPRGLVKQRLIAQVMERIVTQTIPQAVINDPRLDWDPVKNTVTPAPAAEIEARGEDAAPAAPAADQQNAQSAQSAREPDTRYALLLRNFQAQRAADPYSPSAPTFIRRMFELPRGSLIGPAAREIPEERVVELLTEVVTSPLVPKVGDLIQKRLGRPLQPHDLWYSGFQARGKHTEAELDALTRKRYPTAAAFQRDVPRILKQLGFPADKARFLSEHIAVDPSRGAGHAMQAARRGDLPRLRTRVGAGGMDYKGYNIAVHELGHNVEQVFSLYEVDHTLLAGVPNNAFTEALAFVFQARDLELLGLSRPDAETERMRVLSDFWATYEIAGVGLLEIAVWHWMYDHPDATPAALREQVVRLAGDLWDRYYAPVLGGRSAPLLGIYSHMISEMLYLPDYPIGHLIAFQIEEAIRKSGGPLGPEFARMARHGDVLPDLWMQHATGAPLSAGPLLRAAATALSVK